MFQLAKKSCKIQAYVRCLYGAWAERDIFDLTYCVMDSQFLRFRLKDHPILSPFSTSNGYRRSILSQCKDE